MTSLELALGFVFISNAVFLVAAGGVLYRILQHTRDGHEALIAAADETRSAGKQLQHLAHTTHEQFGKAAAAGGGVGGGDGAAIERLTKLVQDLARQMGRPADGPELIADKGGDKEGDKSDRPHRSELDRALAQNHRLRSMLEQLRLQLDEAHKTVADMRRDQRIAATEALENMRQMVTRLHGQLEQARKSSREAEKRAMSLESELVQVRDQIQGAKSPAELLLLEQRLDKMQRENSSLTSEVDELKDLIKRTLREKDFIEDRFLKLDKALDGSADGAPDAVPTSVNAL
jgi:DNA repair exonuclease SbcCD ATPase subunit